MKKLNEFVYIAPTEPEDGAGYVLCTRPPYYVAKVIRSKNSSDITLHVAIEKPLAYAICSGYNIILSFFGSLDNTVKVNSPDWQQTLTAHLQRMAAWYKERKIDNNPGFYLKFLND